MTSSTAAGRPGQGRLVLGFPRRATLAIAATVPLAGGLVAGGASPAQAAERPPEEPAAGRAAAERAAARAAARPETARSADQLRLDRWRAQHGEGSARVAPAPAAAPAAAPKAKPVAKPKPAAKPKAKAARPKVRKAERATVKRVLKKVVRKPRAKRAEQPASAAGGSVVGTASTLRGIRYVWGGTSRSGFDCSGLTQYVFRKHGVKLPRTAHEQYRATRRVSDPRPGDLVFILRGGRAKHVGIYAGHGKFWDAPRAGRTVGLHDYRHYGGTVRFGRA